MPEAAKSSTAFVIASHLEPRVNDVYLGSQALFDLLDAIHDPARGEGHLWVARQVADAALELHQQYHEMLAGQPAPTDG